jgi:hypothetical protein
MSSTSFFIDAAEKKENKKYSGKRKQSAFPCCSVSLNLGKTQGHGSVTGWGGVVASLHPFVEMYPLLDRASLVLYGVKENRPLYDMKPGPDGNITPRSPHPASPVEGRQFLRLAIEANKLPTGGAYSAHLSALLRLLTTRSVSPRT